MQDWEINLKERGPQKVVANLRSLSRTDDRLNDHLILTSPCDLGVIRNGGKRGAKHGPQALLAPFLAMVSPQSPSLNKKQMALELFKQKASSLVPEDFEKVQKEEVQAFTALLSPKKPLKKLLHLGGGHDHIHPLVSALKDLGPLVIINVDAHLDTRPDQLPHSGTPFRQILKESPNVSLYQIGIHNFANGEANYQGVGSMQVLPWTSAMAPSEVESLLNSKIADYKDATLILSVDCDGLDASFMPAVSAPNHNGLSAEQFHAILKVCQNFWTQSNKPAVLGLYEFNPLYDNLAQGAARFLAQVIYRFFYGVSHSHE